MLAFVWHGSQDTKETIKNDPDEHRIQGEPDAGADETANADSRVMSGPITKKPIHHRSSHQTFSSLSCPFHSFRVRCRPDTYLRLQLVYKLA